MNPDFPQNEREQLEAKLTAFLLGELPPDEVVALCKAMDRDPELAALYEKLKQTIGFVRESTAKTSAEPESQVPLKLSEGKREKLLAQFKTIAPKEFAKPRRSVMDRLALAAACVVALGMLAALLLPSLSSAKRKSMGGLAQWDTLSPATAARHSMRAEKSPVAAAPAQREQEAGGERASSQAMAATPPPTATPMGGIILPADNPTSDLGAEPANRSANNSFIGRYAFSTGNIDAGTIARLNGAGNSDDSDNFQISHSRFPSMGPIVATNSMNLADANGKSEIVLPSTPGISGGGFGGGGGGGTLQWKSTTERSVQTLNGRVPNLLAANGSIPMPGETIAPAASTPPSRDALNLPMTNVMVAAKFVAVEEQDKKVASLQKEVGELHGQFGVSDAAADDFSHAVLMTADRLKELDAMRVQKEADYNQQATLLEKLKAMSPEERKKALPVAYQDPQLGTLLNELDLAQQNLVRLKVDYAQDHPKYQAAENLVNDLNKKVDDRAEGILLGLQSRVTASKAFLDTISNDISTARRIDMGAASNAAPYFAAREELEDVKRWRQILAMRTGQEQVEKDLPRARMVTIMDTALPNQQPPQGLWEKIRHAFTGKVESTARIDVEQEHPDIAGVGGEKLAASYDPYFLLTEFETIQSDAVLSKVVDAMNLEETWGKKYNGGQPMSKADVETRIKSQLKLKPVPNTKLIGITAYGDNPEEAAKLANTIAECYRNYRSEEYEDLKNHGIKSLQVQLEEQDKKVQLAQAKVDELAKQYKISGDLSVQQADRALPKPVVPPPTPQPEMLTRENAFSTFSLNVSDVSFKLAAASLEKGQMPEPASIRSEEFINAFDYRDPEAPAGVPIAFASERARYPFAHNRELLRFSLKTAAAGRQAGRPMNIVLLLDNSGSMERADRVRIIQEALSVLARQLNARDTFSIVTFARTAQLRVDGIPGNQAAVAATEIARLTPEGGTNLGDALDLAYETALKHYLANGDNRVVLLTDGAANLGDVNPDALKQKVEAHRKQGVALDCFGIGWEDYNDDLLEVLTRNGDGRYGFINSPEEASTTFVSQIAGALHVAAADVKVQVEFNPKRVISYRQIGYAKHQLTKEQFRDNTVDAAEIAAQEAGNALYTIEINPQGEGSVATVHVRYKVPGTTDYREQAWDVAYTGSAVALEQASPAMRLAATASAFSEWLVTSPFANEVSPDALLKYLNGVPQVYGADKRPAKLEWMIRQAKSISGK